MTFRKTIAAATSAFAITLAAAPALMMTTQAATAQSEETYSSDQLDAFVEAFLEVSELRMVYTERLQSATEEAEQQAIVEEGNEAIVTAIDGVEGMDVETYSAILEEAGTDTELNDRLTARLEEAAEQAASEG